MFTKQACLMTYNSTAFFFFFFCRTKQTLSFIRLGSFYLRAGNSFLSSVSLDDISAIRIGRQSEGLRKNTEEQVEGRCFSIVFKGRRKNLDLIASSEEEAKQWVNSLQKIISSIKNLNSQQKTEQYPCHDRRGYSMKLTGLQKYKNGISPQQPQVPV